MGCWGAVVLKYCGAEILGAGVLGCLGTEMLVYWIPEMLRRSGAGMLRRWGARVLECGLLGC